MTAGAPERPPSRGRRTAAQPAAEWDGAAVRAWLDGRIAAARAEQVRAERGGRERQDDCDLAAAEELVCTALRPYAGDQGALLDEAARLLDREDHLWRGVYDDRRFDRHVRGHARKLRRMAKANEGFGNRLHHQ